MKVYIWQKGSLRLGNEECQEVLAALLIACYCAPARAQIDETRVFSTFLHLPNIWPDGCGSWFSFNIWSIFFFSINIWSIFWFSINIWSIFDLMDATSSLLANIGCTGVGYCLLGSPQESTFGFTPSLPRFFFGFDGMQRKEELVLSAVVPHSSKTNTIDKMLETWEMQFRWLLTNDPLTLQKD